MQSAPNLIGQHFGRLTVVSRAENTRTGKARWHCQCDCGRRTIVLTHCLRSGRTKSCGCWKLQKFRERVTKHKLTDLPEYLIFYAMLQRCTNPRSSHYARYGGRGITVQWQNVEEFIRDMGPRPSPQHSIDRIDNDGPYCKENCRWATRSQQQNNQHRNHIVTYQGQRYTVSELAVALGLKPGKIFHRLYRGFTLEESIYPGRYTGGAGRPRVRVS